jgi:probable F420-dependent oxidoreductase
MSLVVKLGVLPSFRRSEITNAEWVAAFLGAVEECGCESVWTVEHVVVADDYEPLYPYSDDGRMPGRPDTVMPDPLEWLAYAAALTSTVRLGTAVVVVPLHAAATLAKRAATVDALSGGRVMLGVGVGWQKEEYAAVGVPYDGRGHRLEESVAAMRALWRDDLASYDGSTVRFMRVRSEPKPIRGSVPIVVGGSSDLAARRAGRIGDGWFPFVISPDDFTARAGLLRAAAETAGRDPDTVELTVWPASWDPTATFDVELVRRYAAAGASRIVVSTAMVEGAGRDDLRRFLERVQREVIDAI